MSNTKNSMNTTSLFLCGDVMTGRGIDQILSYPSHPAIYESYMRSAEGYVRIAEQRKNINIPRKASWNYIWGDALSVLEGKGNGNVERGVSGVLHPPDVRIINLETAVTTNDEPCPGKGIQYRMNPHNIPCISAAGIDCCTLANNHVLDWEVEGLLETVDSLRGAELNPVGAGKNVQECRQPALIPVPRTGGKVIVLSMGSISSGIPPGWAASKRRPGVFLVDLTSAHDVQLVSEIVDSVKQENDIVVGSIHMGGNWGYEIPDEQQWFARRLIDSAQVDVVHGHSSHHPKGIEVYKGHPIFYGCGDFINDYEGIGGDEGEDAEYRGDLRVMYFVTINNITKQLEQVEMVPLKASRFSLEYCKQKDVNWLCQMLRREILGSSVSVELSESKDSCILFQKNQTINK